MSICNYIKEEYTINNSDIIVTHDAVRPFITQRIINDNIEKCNKYGATDTVVQAIDTIVESKKNEIISNIPVRGYMYQGQTPQSFRIIELMETYSSLTDKEKNILTDACKMYVMKNKYSYGIIKIIGLNLISISGFVQVLMLLSIIFHLMDLFTIFYFILNLMICIITLKKLLKE